MKIMNYGGCRILVCYSCSPAGRVPLMDREGSLGLCLDVKLRAIS